MYHANASLRVIEQPKQLARPILEAGYFGMLLQISIFDLFRLLGFAAAQLAGDFFEQPSGLGNGARLAILCGQSIACGGIRPAFHAFGKFSEGLRGFAILRPGGGNAVFVGQDFVGRGELLFED